MITLRRSFFATLLTALSFATPTLTAGVRTSAGFDELLVRELKSGKTLVKVEHVLAAALKSGIGGFNEGGAKGGGVAKVKTVKELLAEASRSGSNFKKIDRALAGALKGGELTHKVLITVRPGSRATIRKALEQHGGKIRREHSSLNVLVADVLTADILELAENDQGHLARRARSCTRGSDSHGAATDNRPRAGR